MGGCREAAGEGGKAAAGLGPPPPPDDAQKDTQTQRGRTVRCAPPPRLPPARAPAPPLKRARIARLRKRFASFESWPLLMRRWFSIASSPAMQAGPRALAVCGPPRLDQDAWICMPYAAGRTLGYRGVNGMSHGPCVARQTRGCAIRRW